MQDILNILTVLGAAQGLFFSLILLNMKSGNRRANRYLALFLLFTALTMIGIVGYASRWVLQHPHTALLHTPVAMIMGVPLVHYVLALTRKHFVLRVWHRLMYLPLLLTAVALIPFYSLPEGEKRAVLEASFIQFPALWRDLFVVNNVYSFFLLAACFLLVIRHERIIREVYSNPLNKSLVWTRHFLIAGALIFFTCVAMSIRDITWADSFSNFMFSLLIYGFGYKAMRQPEVFADVSDDALPQQAVPLIRGQVDKYRKSGLTEARASQLLIRLEQVMEQEKPFLDPGLNLQQLANRLEIPPHQLSQLLNQYCRESFSDFVNRYRVERFKKAVMDPGNHHLSLLAIAFDCGFNSKAAFNAIFKKMTGTTPSEYSGPTGG